MASRKKESKLWFLLVNSYLVNFSWGLFAPLFALVVAQKGGGAQAVGFSWGIYTLVCGTLMIMFGRMEDKERRYKAHLIVGNLFLLAGSIAYIFVDTISQLIFTQLIFAIGFGLYTPALKTAYAKLEILGQEATEWAMMDGGNMLVMSAAAVAGGMIVQRYGLSALFLSMVAVLTLGTIILMKGAKRVRARTR